MPNQDSVATCQLGELGLAAAVADGHGHYRHFRSARGSKIAVAVACEVAQEVTEQLARPGSASQVESAVRATLIPEIVARWREAVAEDLAAEPFSPQDDASRAPGDEPVIAYGSTLLLGFTWEQWMVLTQIGDGDMVAIRPDGGALQPVPGDPLLDGNQTTSLCGQQAEQDFRIGVVDTVRVPLIGVLIATDGYGNAQVTDSWAQPVSADLAEMLGERDLNWLAEQLPMWAGRCASADGSADDTTVALMVPSSAARLRAAAKAAGPVSRPLSDSELEVSTLPPTTAEPVLRAGAGAESATPVDRTHPMPAVEAEAAMLPPYAGPRAWPAETAVRSPGPAPGAAPVPAPGPPGAGAASAVAPPIRSAVALSAAAAPTASATSAAPAAPPGARPVAASPAAPRPARRRRIAVIATVVVLVAGAVAAGITLATSHSPPVHSACRPVTTGSTVSGTQITACDRTGKTVHVTTTGLPSGTPIREVQAAGSLFALAAARLWWTTISDVGAGHWRELTNTLIPHGAVTICAVSRGVVIDGPHLAATGTLASSLKQVVVNPARPLAPADPTTVTAPHALCGPVGLP